MDHPMWSRKRLRLHEYENEQPPYKMKCLAGLKTLQDQCDGSERATHHVALNGRYDHLCPHAAYVNKEATQVINNTQISCWADTQHAVKRVMDGLKFRQASDDFFLNYSVNKKFLEFHSDFSDECGAEDKQHSWAVIEKQEEIIMYGPYYPNYNIGEHSEDIIIKQTQELLESESVSEDGKVYVFTMNSPCLARNTDPCMLNLVHKAQEWWSVYGVSTYIGYVRCWGFKGNKENLFRDINYQQLDCLNQAEDFEDYVNAVGKMAELKPLGENLYSAVQHLVSGQESFPLITPVQGHDWKSYVRDMLSNIEGNAEEEKNTSTQEVNTMIEAAQAQISGTCGTFEQWIETGKVFAVGYTFSQEISDDLRHQMKLIFQQWWQEMVRDKYAEFIREKLTDDFNRRTVELFIKDIVECSKEYLQIGRIQFPDNDPKAPRVAE